MLPDFLNFKPEDLLKRPLFAIVLLGVCLSLLLVPSALPAEDRVNVLPKYKTQHHKPPVRYGLWVEAEGRVRPLNEEKELERLLSRIREEPLSDVYVQIFRHGRSWFPSKVLDESPYYDLGAIGIDPMQRIMEVAEEKGVRVHAWINALRIGHDKQAKVFKEMLKPEDVLVDSTGVSLYDSEGHGREGCMPDAPGMWLDPDSERVRQLLKTVTSEILARYPGLDGIHLDMIRSTFVLGEKYGGGKKICTGFSSKKFFDKKFAESENSGGKAPDVAKSFTPNVNPDVSAVVRVMRRFLDLRAPHLEFSAAVLSNQNMAVNHAGQNWPQWIRSGLIDSVVTMTYTDDNERFMREVSEALIVSPTRVQIGIGAWLALGRPDLLAQQSSFILDKKAPGLVLFSYANLAQENGEPLFATPRGLLKTLK